MTQKLIQENANITLGYRSIRGLGQPIRLLLVAATAHIIEYIAFYNSERLHSSIGYQSPEKYEKLCA